MNTVARRSRRGGGFAVLVAVGMIFIIGTALLALTLLFQDDARRTKRHSAELRLRQMLIAGGAAAVSDVSGAADEQREVDLRLPADFETGRITIVYGPVDASGLRATVSATLDGYAAEQVLTFEKNEDGWELAGSDLTRQH